MNRLSTMASVVLALVSASSASAQELNLAATSTARPNILLARTGMDHSLVAELGYRRVLAWGDRQLLLGGDVAFPWGNVDLRDYRVRATAGLPFLGGQRWKLAGWLSPTVRGTQSAGSDMTAVGADLRLTGGYYSRGWFVAGELGVDWVAATHVTLSDAYRSRAYPGAKDGWYGAPGGTVYTGLQGGLSFSAFDVVLRAGLPRSTALGPQTVPAYLTLGVNVPLPR